MTVDYVYCPYCGLEELDTDVALGGNYASGRCVICPDCGEETADFEECVDGNDEDEE